MTNPVTVITHWLVEVNGQAHRDKAREVVSALDSAGFKVVPKEATEAMMQSGFNFSTGVGYRGVIQTWEAMVKTAPDQYE